MSADFPEMRASDADRDRVLDILREAAADGRLTVDEFDERMEAALSSRTLGELAALTADLGPGPATPQAEVVVRIDQMNHSDLCRFLAAHMADARLADWRFEPADGDIAAPNRVEWTFRLNPYAGGEVRQFVREPVMEEGFGVHRPVTIESRLYLNDQYQTVVKQRALVQGGPNDPELAAAVASTTESLLGHSGAYRTCDWTRSSGRGCGEAMQ